MPVSLSSEPVPELSSSDVADVAVQTYEQPVALPEVISLVGLQLAGCRVYVLWEIVGGALQLPGIHIGRDLCAWESIRHLAPERRYVPGVVHVRRFRHQP
eukprot:5807682-Amphidinium_carterae.1